jgi:predicted ArsR family transcriptional regulator
MKESPDILKNRILDLLKNSDGLTITDIAKELNIHQITASKYMAVLEAEKKIKCRSIGMAKVCKIA